MRIVRFSHRNRPAWGVLVTDSKIANLTTIDFTLPPTLGGFLASEGLRQAEDAMRNYVGLPEGALVDIEEVHLHSPVTSPCNLICVGKNYAAHARETGGKPPEQPLFFSKASSAICGPYDPIRKPARVELLDYEAELVVVIGKEASKVKAKDAYDVVFGYTITSDISAREFQYRDRQFFRAKSMATFAPTGPWIVTKDDIADPHHLGIGSVIDGEVRQDSTTSDMIFRIPELIEDLTREVTLMPGDCIATGTPSGVALGHGPDIPRAMVKGEWDAIKDLPETKESLKWYLQHGQVLETEVQGIGSLRNPVRDDD